MKWAFLIAFIIIWTKGNSQIYIDTLFYAHSKYNSYDQEMVLHYYILDDARDTLNLSISTEYSPTSVVGYFTCGNSDLISPYEVFSLLINDKKYNFQILNSPYNIDLLNQTLNIELESEVNPHCWRYDEQSIELVFQYRTDEGISYERRNYKLPLVIHDMSNLFSKGLHSIQMNIRNKFGNELTMSFR